MKLGNEDLQKYAELVILFLKKKECVSVPNSVFRDLLKIIESNNVSFTFKKDPKSKWTIIHALYCNCN